MKLRKSVLVIRIGAKFKDAVAKAIPIAPNKDSVSIIPKYKTCMTKPVIIVRQCLQIRKQV